MKYPRMAMLDALNTVKPALAAKDLIEELSHVWFDGKTLTAYNDALGIQVPLETDFTGGVRGGLLLGLLSNSRAKEVELEPADGGHMNLKAARTRAKLAVLDAERQVWAFDEVSTKDSFEITDDFVRCLKAVMVSVGNDTSIPEKLGVTVVSEGSDVVLYTTDSKAISSATAGMPKGKGLKKGGRVILPTAFCEQVLRLCSAGGFMVLRSDCAIAGNADGVLVYARLVDCPRPLDFEGTLGKHANVPKKQIVEVPTKLAMALDRAIVLLEGVVGEAVTMTVAGGKLKLEAHAEGRGNLRDYIDLPDGVPDIALQVDPELVKRALPLATTMAMTENAVILFGDDSFVYLASTSGG